MSRCRSYTQILRVRRPKPASVTPGLSTTGSTSKSLWKGRCIRASYLSLEVLLPTGDEDKGLGGGATLVRPTVVVKFKPSARWSIDPLFRYVISLDDYFVGGNPDSPVATPDEDATDRAGFFPGLGVFADLVKVRGLNIEVPFVRTLADNPYLSFIAIKPEIFHSSSEDNDGTTVTLKLELGKRLNDRFGISGELALPVQGDTTFDAVLKVTGNISF